MFNREADIEAVCSAVYSLGKIASTAATQIGTIALKGASAACETAYNTDWEGLRDQALELTGSKEYIDYCGEFKRLNSLEKRRKIFKTVSEKHTDHVLVVLSKSKNQDFIIGDIRKTRYVVPKSITIGQFIHSIMRIQLRGVINPYTSIFMEIYDTRCIPSPTSTLRQVAESYADKEDGILYMQYRTENAFG